MNKVYGLLKAIGMAIIVASVAVLVAKNTFLKEECGIVGVTTHSFEVEGVVGSMYQVTMGGHLIRESFDYNNDGVIDEEVSYSIREVK